MPDFTVEFTQACLQAKEEGWLKWEPKWGDKCLHLRWGLGIVTDVEPNGLITVKFEVGGLERVCFSDQYVWLPTEGDLLKILKEIPQGMEDVDYCIYEDDVALALLKAVKAVRRKK